MSKKSIKDRRRTEEKSVTFDFPLRLFVRTKLLAFLAGAVVCLGTLVNAGVYSGGNGTPATPYLIANADDIIEMSNTSSDWDKNFLMVADVNMIDHQFSTAVIAPDTINMPSSADFEGESFTGIFDGNEYTIENLIIDTTGVGNDYLGFFGNIASDGVLKNLTIKKSHITGTSDSYFLGVLCGRNDCGMVVNCHVAGDISGRKYMGGLTGWNGRGIISNCSAIVDVSAISYFVGGLVGYNYYGSISGCYANGTVEAERIVGGLVGINNAAITNSYAIGSVSATGRFSTCKPGGLVGENSGSISNCYAASDVSGNGAAGLAGKNSANISNSFWNTEIQTHGVTETIGDGSWIPLINVDGLSTAQLQQKSTFIDAGWDFVGETSNGTCQTWQMPLEAGYPVISIMNGYVPLALDGDGTEVSPYLISDSNELGAVVYYNKAAHFRLVEDINLTDVNWSLAVIPAFNGSLDGNCHKISNLTIDGSGHLGLFGFVSSKGKICNLSIENGSVNGTAEYGVYIGGLIGYNWRGSVDDCHLTCNVSGLRYLGGMIGYNDEGSVSNCSTVGSIYGGIDSIATKEYMGGLVGYNKNGSILHSESAGDVIGGSSFAQMGGLCGYNEYGEIHNCKTYSTVIGAIGSAMNVGGLVGDNLYGSIFGCSANCDVTGLEYNIGGLLGRNRGSVSNCNAIGEINGGGSTGGLIGGNDYDGSVSNCYHIGNVNGGGDLGGLIGGLYSGMVSNCYSIGSVTGTSHSVGGLVGDFWVGSISNCYAAGDVFGTETRIGGLVGNCDGSVSNCFWDIEIQTHGITDSVGFGGGTLTNVQGMITSQMQTQSTFTGYTWDFLGESTNGNNDFWRICVDGIAYPRLSWEYSINGDFACPDGVNTDDLILLSHNWLNSEELDSDFTYACDPTFDGVTNLADFVIVAENWLNN